MISQVGLATDACAAVKRPFTWLWPVLLLAGPALLLLLLYSLARTRFGGSVQLLDPQILQCTCA
jgi:hypothetical protein